MPRNSVKKTDVEEVFNHWNSCKIIVHRYMNHVMEQKIKKLLETYPVDYVKDMISTYAEILHSDEYILTYKWSINEWCRGAFNSFLPEMEPRKRYAKKDKGEFFDPTDEEIAIDKRKRFKQWVNASKEEREKLREQWDRETVFPFGRR